MLNISRHHGGLLFALTAACGLGAITTLAKLVYADGGNALTLMLTRFVVSTLVFALLLVLRREKFGVDREQRLPLLLLGCIWSGATICYLLAVETISVSLAVLIFYTYPLLVLAYALLRRQLPASLSLIGLFCGAFIGLILALAGVISSLDPVGILFASLASAGAAFTFICGARVAARTSPLRITFWINLAGLLLILPLVAKQLALPGATAGWLALIAATAFYLIAILSQFQALARLPAARAAFLLNLEPIVSLLLAGLVLGEVLSLGQWCGVSIVISMILLSLRLHRGGA